MSGNGQAAGSAQVKTPLFTTTHWSVVLASGADGGLEGMAALERLCQSYWYPLYMYVRRKGYDPDDARDLTQGFFAMLLEHDYLRLADPRKGRFRTFLLHAIGHYIINEWKRSRRGKRGGGAQILSLSMSGGEERYRLEPVTIATPETVYEKRWATTLLDLALDSLRQEYAREGKGHLFEELAQLLWGKPEVTHSGGYAQVAERLGMTDGAIRVAMHRLRERYRKALEAVVGQTVASPEDVREELRYLLTVVSRDH